MARVRASGSASLARIASAADFLSAHRKKAPRGTGRSSIWIPSVWAKHHSGRFHDAESFKMAKLTDLLQHLIECNVEIKPVFIKGRWCEIDTPEDLERARKIFM